MALRIMLIVTAGLVSGQALLGACGLMGGATSGVLLGSVSLAGVMAAWRVGAFDPRQRLFGNLTLLEAILASAIAGLILERACSSCLRPPMAYDALSFHLHFPAAWMHAGRLHIVPTVFGDVAPAYSPANVELLFHLMMAPFHSDFMARMPHVLFMGIAVAALVSAARTLGARRSGALAGALCFLLLPEAWWQAAAGMVDLPLAALFLANVALLIRLWKQPARADAVTLAVGLGLFIGVKYVALPFALPLAGLLAAVVVRHRRALPSWRRTMLWMVGLGVLILATGGFWYVRNALVTGNPLYPLAVRIGTWNLWPGLHDSRLMREWIYHYPVNDGAAFREQFFAAGWGFVIAGLLALLWRWRGPEPWLAGCFVLIYWFVVPYQHSRFLLACYGMIALALAAAVKPGRRGGFAAVLPLAALVGLLVEWPDAARLGVIGAAGLGAGLWCADRRVPLGLLRPITVGLLIVATGIGLHRYRDTVPQYTVTRRPDLEQAWEWVHANVRDRNVAYTGVNLPFPLHGHHLANRVCYVNVAGDAERPLHAIRPSGPIHNAEPAPYRNGATPTAWLANLVTEQCDTLFVAGTFPIVRQSIRCDARGFPIERTWADSAPHVFRRVFVNDGVGIYRIDREAAQRLLNP